MILMLVITEFYCMLKMDVKPPKMQEILFIFASLVVTGFIMFTCKLLHFTFNLYFYLQAALPKATHLDLSCNVIAELPVS